MEDSKSNTPLGEIIFQQLLMNPHPGMRFDHFMDLALYHPLHGYYASPFERKIGRQGDFFTSVSAGDTFGLLLSYALEKKWRAFGAPNPFFIIEQGAHDGQLACDILHALEERNSPLRKGVRYCLIEPRAPVRAQLAERFRQTGFGDAAHPVFSAAECRVGHGVFLCNELLDAFPVRRFRWSQGAWQELWVTLGEDGHLATAVRPAPPGDEGLADFLLDWPKPYLAALKEGYTSEYCPGLRSWVEEICPLFQEQGAWWIIDYGWEAAQYFDPGRTEGTLQSFRQHGLQPCPLQDPGEADITAHVNFSGLVRQANRVGLRLERSSSQGRFLTEAARPWLLGLEGVPLSVKDRSRIRQFHTLTHPGLMGEKFRILELADSSSGGAS